MAEITDVDLRRAIPAVDRLLGEPPFLRLTRLYGRASVRVQVRNELEALRSLLRGGSDPVEVEDYLAQMPSRIEGHMVAALGKPLQRVINATGVLLHTNLGRAPIGAAVIDEIRPLLTGYCDLEIDLDSGRRGDRNRRTTALLRQACGAEDALVTNNNAAAMVLALAVLAGDGERREVVVSRGELVEIGGSFRVPDILSAAGAELVEVGTTNRTRPEDYAAAIGPRTALLLKVMPSNYRIVGFTRSVSAAELVGVGQEAGVPVLVDEGSGLLRRRREPQLADHPAFTDLLEAGCDLVAGSGDKLLGGPQAGLLVGRREWIRRCSSHPLYRALRPDRYTLAALESVLRRKAAGEPSALDELWPDSSEHRRRLKAVASEIGPEARIVQGEALLGGGSAPERGIAGEVLAVSGTEDVLKALRQGSPAVVGYRRGSTLHFDLRTVERRDDRALAAAIRAARLPLAGNQLEGEGVVGDGHGDS